MHALALRASKAVEELWSVAAAEQRSREAHVSRCGQDSRDGCDTCTCSTREQHSRGASVGRCDRYSRDGCAARTRSPSREMQTLEEGNEYYDSDYDSEYDSDYDSDYDSESVQDNAHALLRELEELRAEKKKDFEEGRVFGSSVRPLPCSYVATLKSSHAQNRNSFAHTNANNLVCTLNCVCSLCAHFTDSSGAWINTSCQRRPGCKCSTCRTFFDENGKWDEVRASWSISRAPSQDWSILPVFGPWSAPGLVSQDCCAIPSIATPTLPRTDCARTLHNSSNIYLIAAGTALVATPFGPAVESPPHAKSVAYIQSGDFKIVSTAHFAALFPTPLSERGE